jgi:hypothetical protein
MTMTKNHSQRETIEYIVLHNKCLQKSDEELVNNIKTFAIPAILLFIATMVLLAGDFSFSSSLFLTMLIAISLAMIFYKIKYTVRSIYSKQLNNLIRMPDHKLELLMKKIPFTIALDDYYVNIPENDDTSLFMTDLNAENIDR